MGLDACKEPRTDAREGYSETGLDISTFWTGLDDLIAFMQLDTCQQTGICSTLLQTERAGVHAGSMGLAGSACWSIQFNIPASTAQP